MREYSKDKYEHNKEHIAEMRGIAAQLSDPLHKKALGAIIDALEAQVRTAYALAVERDELLAAMKHIAAYPLRRRDEVSMVHTRAFARVIVARIEAAA